VAVLKRRLERDRGDEGRGEKPESSSQGGIIVGKKKPGKSPREGGLVSISGEERGKEQELVGGRDTGLSRGQNCGVIRGTVDP